MSKQPFTIQTLIEEMSAENLSEYLESVCRLGVAWEKSTRMAVSLLQVPNGLATTSVQLRDSKKIFTAYVEGLIFFDSNMGTTHARVRVIDMEEDSYLFTCEEVLAEFSRRQRSEHD